MRILAIETSCDETAVSVVEACPANNEDHPTNSEGRPENNEIHFSNAKFAVLGNALYSQIETHKEFGGVFPMLAKREHAKNLVPITRAALREARLLHENRIVLSEEQKTKLDELLHREQGLLEKTIEFLEQEEKPDIDAIAVTQGPGLEPALWVGINFAQALATIWKLPVVPVNHMEGHILSALLLKKSKKEITISNFQFPILALLISGGHTELVLMEKWLSYNVIGETRDDAVGEAFDKVARMLGLPYPGGPEISRLAEQARNQNSRLTRSLDLKLPRPMIGSDNFDFSFSGLKTSVLYALKKIKIIDENVKMQMAREFENAATDVLVAKTEKALEECAAQTLIIGGGVSANIHIRRTFETLMAKKYPDIKLLIPSYELSTDNAIMIAIAGYARLRHDHHDPLSTNPIQAHGKLLLT